MFCKECGAELEDGSKFCKNCGGALEEQNNNKEVDKGGFKWGLLGFLFFEAGLAVYFVWRKRNPSNANAIKKGLIFGIVIKFILCFIYGCLLGLDGILVL